MKILIVFLPLALLASASSGEHRLRGPSFRGRAHGPTNDFFDKANARIEQHRKADILVSVVDSNGNAIPNAVVHVNMTRHKFRWGMAVDADRLSNISYSNSDETITSMTTKNNSTEDNRIYREKLLENFNSVVFENDLKWPAWEGAWGPTVGWSHAESALDWLEANELPVRGHYLSNARLGSSMDGYAPPNFSDATNVPELLFPHITEKLQTVGDRIMEWDVINHPTGGSRPSYGDLFGTSFYSSIINHARSIAPAGTSLWLNEDGVLIRDYYADEYEQILNFLIADNAEPDGIGFMGHFKYYYFQPDSYERMYEQMERFSLIIPHLQITELDIDAAIYDDNGTILFNDKMEQARLMNNVLIAAFSHEKLEGITMWAFWEPAVYRPARALYDPDWTERPALQAYRDLVFDTWWTNESGTTNASGQFATRGFKGKYLVTVEYNGYTCVKAFDTDVGSIVFDHHC